jgi:hypothetical protein
MSEITNNSLNDLGGKINQQFNTLLSKQGRDNNGETIRELRAKINALNMELLDKDSKLSQEQKETKLQQINTLNKQIEDLSSVNAFSFGENSNNSGSLFERYAIIDYARYVAANDINWEHYKKIDEKITDRESVRFKANSTNRSINTPVPGDDSLNSSNSDGLSIPHLISWSELYPALQLRFQDFAYCKKLGYYPNNRLIVLRRFRVGVPDNLFDYHKKRVGGTFDYLQPLATMVTWYGPTESPIEISYNENWDDNNKGIFETVVDSVSAVSGGKLTKGGDSFNIVESSVIGYLISGTRDDGKKYIGNDPYGNPNLIISSKKRVVAGKGLSSTVNFNRLEFEYEMRYIQGVDPGIAMLDLISNAMKMGTSTAEFRMPIDIFKSSVIKNVLNNDFEINFDEFSEKFAKFKDDLVNVFNSFLNNALKVATDVATNTGKNIEDLIKNFSSHIISRYREQLKASVNAETGLPSGIWHVTVGNPKNPIVSCGDLIIKSNKLELGTELGYNDFPNSFKVIITLESGRDELERIFNSGRGRVYVYSSPLLQSDYFNYNPKAVPDARQN